MRLVPISDAQRGALEQLFQLYLHDMSEFMGWPLSPDGTFGVPQNLLDPYWERADHWPYFIMYEEQIIGFSLVRRAPTAATVYDMGQFFIVRAYRGADYGMRAFALSLNAHPGQWQVRVLPKNKPAVRFWSKAVREFATGEVVQGLQPYGEHEMEYFHFATV